MSRIGKQPVSIPDNVKVAIDGCAVTIEGPKGKLTWEHRSEIETAFDADARKIVVTRKHDNKEGRALHGLTRALIQNMVTGVTQGYEKRLEIVGVGYTCAVQHNRLELRVGLANELKRPIPEGLTVSCPDTSHVIIQGCDKQLVGMFAAETRALRKPEPYKGKGIRYQGEHVKIKPGKAAT